MLKIFNWIWSKLYWSCRSLFWGFPLSKTRIVWDTPADVPADEEWRHALRIVKAWEFLRPIFASHGFHLYTLLPQSINLHPLPLPRPADPKDISFPYGRRFYETDKEAIFTFNSRRVWAARDIQGRDVVIKVVRDATYHHEFEVLQYLNSDTVRSDPRNYTIPVIKFLTFDDFIFAVMPRWDMAVVPAFDNIAQVVHFADSLLEGLYFMHERRIYHSDILDQNCGMNVVEIDCESGLHGRRDVGSTHYAFYDFETSRLCPRNIALEDTTLVLQRRRLFSELLPKKGESYNPFPFDMISLADVLRHSLNKYIEKLIPETGDFFDAMFHEDASKRPTATQALADFRVLCSRLSNDELAQILVPT